MAEKTTPKSRAKSPDPKKISLDGTPTCLSSSPSSFMQMLEIVREQIDYKFFVHLAYQRELVEDIARIITEVYMYRDDISIDIEGAPVPVGLVKEIYRQLTNEHICAVVNNFKRSKTVIGSVKPYIRTCLYNIVFTLALRNANEEAVEGDEEVAE